MTVRDGALAEEHGEPSTQALEESLAESGIALEEGAVAEVNLAAGQMGRRGGRGAGAGVRPDHRLRRV